MNIVFLLFGIALIVVGIRFLYLAKVKEHVAKNARDGKKGFRTKKKEDARKYRIIAILTIVLGIALSILSFVIN